MSVARRPTRVAAIIVVFGAVLAACGQASPQLSASPQPSAAASAAVSAAPPTVLPSTATASPSAAVAVAPSPSTDWPMLRGDAAHTGQGGSGPVGGPVLRWHYQANGSVNTSPVVVGGVVYAISDEGTLHALDAATGKQLWTFAGAFSADAGPTVWDGVVYVADRPGVIHAVDATSGHERWHSAAAIPGGLTIGDGGIYVASKGVIVALDATTGTERWRYSAPSAGLFHNPALANGVVYAGSDLGGVVAVDAATGTLRWHADTGTDGTTTAVVANGIAYVGDNGSRSGHLFAFDAATGKLLWRLAETVFSPAVTGGVAYSGSAAGYVSARDALTGVEKWRFPVKGETGPVGVAAGVVYVPASGEHRVYALDAATGRELWHVDVDSGMDGSVAIAGGAVYVGTANGGVYAIGGNGLTVAVPSAAPSPAVSSAPSVAPSTAPSPTAAPTTTPSGAASGAKLLWLATGGPSGLSTTGDMAVAPDGRIWVADTGGNRFAIFNPDGSFVEYWGTSGFGQGQFELQRSNGDGYGMLAFAPDGSFYVLDVGNRRVQHFDKNRTFLGAWGSFGTGPGQYSGPIGISVDAKGVVFILDEIRGVVEKYNATGTVLGSFSALFSGFNSSNSLALDSAGNIYVSDIGSTDIEKFGPSGKLVTRIGSYGTGTGQFNGQPGTLAVDAQGRVFVADGYFVRVFDKSGKYLASLDTQQASDGNGGFITGVLLDGQGDLYVSTTGSGSPDHVSKFQLAPSLVGAAQAPSPVTLLWQSTGGPGGTGGVSFPNGLAMDPQGRLWVADTGNSRFAIFNPDGSFAGDWGAPGTADGQFELQRSNGDGFGAVAFAPDGSFYVLDVGNHRVQHFDANRTFLNTWGSFGTGPGQFSDPFSIAVDSKGVVYVADDNRNIVEKYDSTGKVVGSFVPSDPNGMGTGWIAVDRAGNVFVSDDNTFGVYEFDPSGKLIRTIGSAGTGPGQFQGQPGGLAIDAQGRIFVIDGYADAAPGYAIRVFDKRGAYLTSFDSGQPADGSGFAVDLVLDGHGDLYVGISTTGSGKDHVEKFQLLPPLVTK